MPALYFLNVKTWNASDAPAAVVMGIGFLAFGVTMVLLPERVKENVDRLANSWKQDSWHPYKMPYWALRGMGLVVIALATVFFYIAFR